MKRSLVISLGKDHKRQKRFERRMLRKQQREMADITQASTSTRSIPPGLKGKEIGLYYRDRMLERRSRIDTAVIIPENVINKIDTMLEECDEEESSQELSQVEQLLTHIKTRSFQQMLDEKKEEIYEMRDKDLDKTLSTEYNEMINSSKYKRILSDRSTLPVYDKRSIILESIEKSQFVLISGDTGCGKTTQVPQFILDSYLSSGKGSQCSILCTQPRRIPAIAMGERVAWERTEKLGVSVGYQIRLQSIKPRERGSITFCTTGILLRRLETDPLLQNVSHIFLDEIHERDINTDIAMGLLKEIAIRRPELRVILMSATLNANIFSDYFDNCVTMEVKGTLFPIKDLYLEDILEETKFQSFPREKYETKKQWHKHLAHNKKKANEIKAFCAIMEPYARSLRNKYSPFVIDGILNPNSESLNVDLICQLIFHISSKMPEGAILVFLPGYDNIAKVTTAIQRRKWYSDDAFLIVPLHSTMPTVDQKAIFQKAAPNVRKVILSTNIAETSITINDVVYVIDSGRMKSKNFNADTKLETLELTWVAMANVKQRRGRAGRVQAGYCYHLYTRVRQSSFDQHPIPEILRSRLEAVILTLKMLRIHDVREFFSKLITSPKELIVTNGIELLKRMSALDHRELLTALGLHLARLPIDPQIGKMVLLASLFKCLDPITSVAAYLSFKDPFYRPLGKEDEVDEIKFFYSKNTRSDHLTAVNVIAAFRNELARGCDRHFCYQRFLSRALLQQLLNLKSQFCDILRDAKFIGFSQPSHDSNNDNSSKPNLLSSIVAAGLYPNVAKLRHVKFIRNRPPILNLITPEEGRVYVHPSSVNSKQTDFEHKFFVYFVKQKTSSIFLYDTTMINPLALLIFGDGDDGGLDDQGNHIISLSDSFRFKTNESSAEMILRLRKRLNELLKKKAIDPSPIEPGTADDALINAIIEVLSIHGTEDDKDEDDDDNLYDEDEPNLYD